MKRRFRVKVPAAFLALGSVVALTAASLSGGSLTGRAQAAEEPPHPVALDNAIIAAAKRHGVPERLVRRVIMRESKYNPQARNRSYWGLMQISYPTAKSMGFRGTPQELLNPVVNLRYAVPYLANAFVIAGRREDAAVRLYAAGYYATAKSRGLIDALRTANSSPLTNVPVADDQPILAANAVVQPPESIGIFGALFGPGSSVQPQAQPSVQVASGDAGATATPPLQQTASNAPAGTFNGPTATMVADKSGELAPPKKWARDGGLTLIARGEQGLDQIPSRIRGTEAAPRKTKRSAHKFTAFASLEVPASSAQAYSGTAAQDPRFAAAASQAAIMQATADRPTATTEPTVQAGQAVQDSQAKRAKSNSNSSKSRSAKADADDETKPAKRKPAREARKQKQKERTQEARAEKRPAETASPAPSTQ